MTGGSYKLFVDRMSGEEDNIFKDVYRGFLLGRVGFIKEKLKELKTQVESDEISYRKELNVGIEPDIIIEEVARRIRRS
jgi:hypothetical protein